MGLHVGRTADPNAEGEGRADSNGRKVDKTRVRLGLRDGVALRLIDPLS